MVDKKKCENGLEIINVFVRFPSISSFFWFIIRWIPSYLPFLSSSFYASLYPIIFFITIDVHPFAHLEVSSVLQEAKVFNDAAFVKLHPKRCCYQITKLMWFLSQVSIFIVYFKE